MHAHLLSQVWRYPGRSTRALVDLDAIAGNVTAVSALLGPNVNLMVVVKANAYGHGAIAVARTAIASGASYLGVATVDEGMQLRAAEIRTPVLVLGPADESEIGTAIEHDIELTVGDLYFATAAARTAERRGAPTKVKLHLKIDTGMRRFGAFPDVALEVATFIANHTRLRLGGIATHFAHADELEEQPTEEQSARLDEVLEQFRQNGIIPQCVHSANSAAALRSRAYDRDMVRLGIGLYGLDPSSSIPILPRMRPAMALLSRVRRVCELGPGEGISYGATYRTRTNETAALIPIGYADGYRRGLSNRAWMSINGAKCPVRGTICMDQSVVGVPGSASIRLGDSVTVAGAPFGDAGPSFDQLAELAGTINYEIATGIDRRVPRMYMQSGRVVAIEDLHGYRAVPPSRPE